MAALCATTGSVGSAVEADTSAMSKARLRRGGELALAGRILHQIDRAGPNDVAEGGPRLGSERQHDGRHRSSCTQRTQTGHTGMAVENRSRDEHVKRAQLLDLGGNVADVGAGHDLVAGAERRLNGPTECGRPADDENPTAGHGAVAVWSVPMHCCSGGGLASCWVCTTDRVSFCPRNWAFLA